MGDFWLCCVQGPSNTFQTKQRSIFSGSKKAFSWTLTATEQVSHLWEQAARCALAPRNMTPSLRRPFFFYHTAAAFRDLQGTTAGSPDPSPLHPNTRTHTNPLTLQVQVFKFILDASFWINMAFWQHFRIAPKFQDNTPHSIGIWTRLTLAYLTL